MGRTMPTECPHGAIVDWGDFGPEDGAPEVCDECNAGQASEPIIRYADIGGEEVFDEFIAHNATVHFEAMGHASWWIGIEVDGRMWHINVGAHNDRVKAFAVCEEVS